MKALLYLRTVRYLRPAQLYWRLRYKIVRALNLIPLISVPKNIAFDAAALARLRMLLALPAFQSAKQAQELLRDQMTFLHRTVNVEEGLPWTDLSLPKLWRYNLHYFDYARWMGALYLQTSRERERESVQRWMHQWRRLFPVGTEVAWDAYTISCRLINWSFAQAAFGFDDKDFLRSYYLHAAWLTRHLERDIRANHLMKNAVALVVAGKGMDSSFLRLGLDLLEEQIAEQILPDGGHYERSPMYHMEVLRDLLTARAVLGSREEYLDAAIDRMTSFLHAILHPDGGIPLFGDSAFRADLQSIPLLDAVSETLPHTHRRDEKTALEQSGFYVLCPEKSCVHLIVKAGEAGPAFQLGHAHCDMLSYEMSVGGQRVVVDSGLHGYAESHLREYCRSTRAHNTIEVNGMDQLETWSTFRVGRRYTPVPASLTREHGLLKFNGGYRAYQGYRHERSIEFLSLETFRVRDSVTRAGAIAAKSFIHFHPEADVYQQGDAWAVDVVGKRLYLTVLGVAEIELVRGDEGTGQSWYCPEFGVALPAPVLILSFSGQNNVTCEYSVRLENHATG